MLAYQRLSAKQRKKGLAGNDAAQAAVATSPKTFNYRLF
jgi:hypothetical protein